MDADPWVLWSMYRPGMEREREDVPVSPCSNFIFQGLKILGKPGKLCVYVDL